ncbi:parallel beta-helix domain-containing protein [Chitinophaga nivalis]|uniref:Right-handed parallel beta-helix repeat-containing protein n=1 Tax=Chitinophaga nivalis TaxID=2991709 RepID=A0ABT3IHD3_9BACT|nr:parallel beta-helix domain-containing protein [Chitinophaga nivalis]MCW3466950.1 right-handed parallel beta-helix repeat-containing protein [Chitinophaga nivalis]MCW3483359.1 right-handed parallel beta-helix repeat-containing protein [Chitinophaga nivalis]
MKKHHFYLCLIALLVACNGGVKEEGGDGYKTRLTFGPGEEARIVEAMLSLTDSSSITLKEGTYQFDNLSIAQVKHILIQGAGPKKTILDFSAQSQGGEGIRVTDVKGFTIDGMTLRDSKGDLIKINKSEKVVVTNLHAIWQVADSTSGGYAIYPVLCKNVLIENCYAEGASDAGIYVGQSDSAIIRKCRAYKNVAGCEIENTSHAEVYDNEFYGNTSGFLVFDLPDLSQRGGYVKAYNNYMHDNNERNFAKAGSFGNTWGVGNAAPGSGIIILAASDVELYNNRIINNNSAAIAVVSGFFIDESAGEKMNDKYFPIPRNIHIHDNVMEMGNAFPEPVYAHHIGKVLVGLDQQLKAQDPARKDMRLPFILYDGITTNILTKGTAVNPDSLCIRQQGTNLFVNIDALNIRSKNWRPSTDMTPFTCK